MSTAGERITRDEEGQVTVEYALLLLVMVVFTVGVQTVVAQSLSEIFSRAADVLARPYP